MNMKVTENNPTILIVNDTPEVLELLAVMLKREGYDVITASDGEQGFNVAIESNPDLIVSDVVMPEMDGLEFCRRLKKDSHTMYIPLLLVSAVRTDEEDSLDGLIAGANDYLLIPFRRQELIVKVAKLIESHRIERHYRELVEFSPDIIITRDMTGHITSVNKAGEEFFGRPASQIVGVNLVELIGKEAAKQSAEATAKLEPGKPLRAYYKLPDAQGMICEQEALMMLMTDANGTPVGVRSLVRDITERAIAKDLLRESEGKYRELVENLNDVLYETDESGIFTYLSPAIQSLTGHEPAQLLGYFYLNLVHADDKFRVDEHFEKVKGSKSGVLECRWLTNTQEVLWVQSSDRAIFRDGNFVGWRGLVTDITERKQAEVALQQSEESYRELFENANDLIYTHDLQGNFTSLNGAGERITGYTREEAMRMNIAHVVLPEHLEYAREMIKRKISRNDTTTYELSIVTKKGEIAELEVSTRLIYHNEMPVGVQGIARDITERKRTEEALHKEREFLNAVLNNIGEGVIACNDVGRLTLSNRATQENYGIYDLPIFAEQWASQYGLYCADGETLMPAEENPLYRALMGEQVRNSEMTIFPLGSNQKRTVQASGQAIFDTNGQKIGAVVALHDTTDHIEAENRLLASVQQLETLTALATAIKDVNELDNLLKGLADAITNFTDYRTCLILLFTDEPPHYPRIMSASSNIPDEFLARVAMDSYPRSMMESITQQGVAIKVGDLGFAAYYPPNRHNVLEQYVPNRYKTNLPMPEFTEGERWHNSDELHVPLITHDGEYIGYISLDDPRSGRVPDKQSVLPVVALSRQVVQLLAQQKSAEALKFQAEREAIVNNISNAVRQSLDIKEVFRTAVNELGAYLDVDRCTLYSHDEDAGVVRNVAEYHVPGIVSAKAEFPLSFVSNLGDKINEEGVVAVDDAENDPDIKDYYDLMLRPAGTRSIMWVAIQVEDKTPATFAISTTRSIRHWTKADMELARSVANQTGIAIRQARLFQKAETTSQREALINRLSLTIRASLRLPEILSAATRELGRALSASRVYLRLHKSGENTSPVTHEYIAPYAYSIKRLQMENEEAIGQILLRQTHTLVINDARDFNGGSDELNKHIKEWSQLTETFSSINCPLVVNGRFRGTLCIDQTDRLRLWNDDEIALVESVASQLSTGIAQAELFEMTKRAKKEWEATFNAMSDGIFIFDNKGVLIRVNRAGAALEDSWPHLLLGRRCCDILRASPGQEYCIVEQAISEGRTVTIELIPEGLNRSLVISAEPLVETESGTIGVVCTARDLSELRKAEAEARERQSLLTNIIESVREPICAIDTRGRFLWSNTATMSTIGYNPEELIGKSFLDLIYSHDHELAMESFNEALAGSARSYEARYQTKESEVRYALIDNAPLVQGDKTTGVLWIARDITEQKQQRAKAAQADKLRALGQLASGVAHDFNNALAAILGRTQLMTRQITDGKVKRNLDIIQTAAEDAAATVRRIQTFARQNTDKQFELLNVANLLRDSIEITRTRWENEALMRGLNITVELKTNGDFYIAGQASELREVFINLIVNAVDAMPKGGRMLISCHERDGKIVLRFKDNGTGMSEEVRERIFEPFYTTKGMQGTGLGLAVSYGIIERHDGSISVTSEIGKGTTFEIELPIVEYTKAVVKETPGFIEMPSLHILVIDDEDFVRDTLADMLEALGHKVVAVDGGASAFNEMSKQHFDIVFTDLSMPQIDGWEVAHFIRSQWNDTSIVMVTGYGAGVQSPNGEADLIDGVIGKPFDFDQVNETISQVMLNPKRTQIPINTQHDESVMIH
jgi:PAS domain S-box-containing protein